MKINQSIDGEKQDISLKTINRPRYTHIYPRAHNSPGYERSHIKCTVFFVSTRDIDNEDQISSQSVEIKHCGSSSLPEQTIKRLTH